MKIVNAIIIKIIVSEILVVFDFSITILSQQDYSSKQIKAYDSLDISEYSVNLITIKKVTIKKR